MDGRARFLSPVGFGGYDSFSNLSGVAGRFLVRQEGYTWCTYVRKRVPFVESEEVTWLRERWARTEAHRQVQELRER